MTLTSGDLLFAAGGDVWEKYGTFVKRTLPEEERGTFSRSSDATYTDRSGNLRTAESGVLRPHYVTSESSYSARLEAARTNSITRSEEFDHSDWSKAGSNGVTVTADDAIAPDGTTTADKIEPGGDSSDRLIQNVSVSDDTKPRALSGYVKKGGSPNVRFAIIYTGGTSKDGLIVMDSTDGSIINQTGDLRSGVEDFSSDWWRVWVVVENGNGNTNASCQIRPDGADGNDAIHLWGAQLEGVSGGAAFPSSYIKTTSSAVSRAADDFDFSNPPSPQEVTIYWKASTIGTLLAGDALGLWELGNGVDSTGPRLTCLSPDPGEIRVFFADAQGDSNFATINDSSLDAVGVPYEGRVVFHSNADLTLGVSVNGGAEQTSSGSAGSSVDFPTAWAGSPSVLDVGKRGASNIGYSDWISGPIIAPGVRTMDEMRSIEV